jgi:antagonist of KipI
MSIEVLAPGLLTCVQDLGRPGHAAIGVGGAGAMDSIALRLANALVGNVENAAALEITLRGPRVRFASEAVIALTGADLDATCGGEPVPTWRPVLLRAGAELELRGVRRGARSYLSVSGGIDTSFVLGSRSADINAALGPLGGRALIVGDELPIGPATSPEQLALAHALRAPQPGVRTEPAGIAAANWSLDPAPWLDVLTNQPIALLRGAHFERLNSASQRTLFDGVFRVGNQSNRVGYRLEGAPLKLAEPLELISEGVVPGTLQLPPGGEPIVLMAEAPTTGGYPRIGQVAGIDLPRLAQRKPGDPVRFAEISLADAQSRYLERERTLTALKHTIAERLRA